jgi:F-type H+-transporting ATPase subunit beta
MFLFANAAYAERGLQAQIEGAVSDDVTLVWYGDYTAGAEPENFAYLDSLITFEVWRAYQGLWPSIDPLHSRSSLTLSERHARLQVQARRLLRRFEDLRTILDKDPRGMDALATDADRRDVERARKLHAFFSQPLIVAELYINLLGEYVPLKDTLDGVEAILDGRADDTSEEKLKFIGGMDRYFRR